MVIRIFQEDTDNVSTTMLKEDRTNIDILTILGPETLTINAEDEVDMRDPTGTTYFTGIVKSVEAAGEKRIVVEDYGSQLKRIIINEVFQNKKPEEIIEDIINNDTDLTYVSSITSTDTINVYKANKKRAWDVVTEMAELLLANFRTDKNKNFQLEREGDSFSSKSISTSNALLDGKWLEDKEPMVNIATVDGDDRQVFEKEELFNGTGAQTTFTLAEIPIDIRVEHPVGTLLDGFVEGQSTGDYKLDDREIKQITFSSAPASGTNNIKVTYTASIPISVRRRSKASRDTYGDYPKVFKKRYIKTRTEARAYADFIIGRFANPLLSSRWIITTNTDVDDFEQYVPNEVINVNDTLRSISGDFIIRKVERQYPGNLKITVGTPENDITAFNKESLIRIKQLEEKDDNSTIINDSETLEENLLITTTDTVTDITSKAPADGFVLDYSPNNQLDKSKKLDGGTVTVLYP